MYAANGLFFCLGLAVTAGAAGLLRHAGDGARALETHTGKDLDVSHVTMVIKKAAGIALASGVMVAIMSVLGCVATKTYEKACSKVLLFIYGLLAFCAVVLASVSSAGEFAVSHRLQMYEDAEDVPAEDSEIYGELVSLSNATYHQCCMDVNGTMMPVPGAMGSGRSGSSGSSDSESSDSERPPHGPGPDVDAVEVDNAEDEGHPNRRLRAARESRKLQRMSGEQPRGGHKRSGGKGPGGKGKGGKGRGGPPPPPRVCRAIHHVLEEGDVCASQEAFQTELFAFLSKAVKDVAIGSTVIAVACAGALIASCSLLWRKNKEPVPPATPVVVNGEAPGQGGCCGCFRRSPDASGAYYRQTDMKPIIVADTVPAGSVQYA